MLPRPFKQASRMGRAKRRLQQRIALNPPHRLRAQRAPRRKKSPLQQNFFYSKHTLHLPQFRATPAPASVRIFATQAGKGEGRVSLFLATRPLTIGNRRRGIPALRGYRNFTLAVRGQVHAGQSDPTRAGPRQGRGCAIGEHPGEVVLCTCPHSTPPRLKNAGHAGRMKVKRSRPSP